MSRSARGKSALFQMDPLYQVHEGHIDEGFRHRIFDALDKSDRLIAVEQRAVIAHERLRISCSSPLVPSASQ